MEGALGAANLHVFDETRGRAESQDVSRTSVRGHPQKGVSGRPALLSRGRQRRTTRGAARGDLDRVTIRIGRARDAEALPPNGRPSTEREAGIFQSSLSAVKRSTTQAASRGLSPAGVSAARAASTLGTERSEQVHD